MSALKHGRQSHLLYVNCYECAKAGASISFAVCELLWVRYKAGESIPFATKGRIYHWHTWCGPHIIINCNVLKLIVYKTRLYIFIYIYRYIFIFFGSNILYFTISGISKVHEQAPNYLSILSKIPYIKYYILYKSMRMGNTAACCTIEIVKQFITVTCNVGSIKNVCRELVQDSSVVADDIKRLGLQIRPSD